MAIVNKVPMTVLGEKLLRQRLDVLKFEERPAVIKAIAEARAHGDLSENAEYHAAKERQGFIEAEIAQVEAKLGRSQVIDVAQLPQNGTVVFATTVELINVNTEETVRYQIVGDDEADIKQGKVSISSPIARALIGRSEDDAVEVNTPSGVIEYEIVKVHYL